MTQKYEPVEWTDETPTQPGTLINKARLDQMQSAHHFADGFEEVDAIPTEDPGTEYHKVVYCTADSTFYRWDGAQWTADIDDDTKRLLEEHEADHANPHQVTKAQVGLGNADNTSDADKPISTATAAALATKADKATTLAGYGIGDAYTKAQVDGKLADGSVTKLGTADVGSDTLPIKLVGGSPTPVADALAKNSTVVHLTGDTLTGALFSESAGANSYNGARLSADKYSTKATGFDVTSTASYGKAHPLAGITDDNGVPALRTIAYLTGTEMRYGVQFLDTAKASHVQELLTFDRAAGTIASPLVQAALDAYAPMVRTVNAQTIDGIKTFNKVIFGTALGHEIGVCGPSSSSYGVTYLMATIDALPSNEGCVFDIIGGLNNQNYVIAKYRIINASNGLTIEAIEKAYSTQYQEPHLYVYNDGGTIKIYGTTMSWTSPRLFLEYWESQGHMYADMQRHTLAVSSDFSTVTLPAGASEEVLTYPIANTVHITGAETITGAKTFSGGITAYQYDYGRGIELKRGNLDVTSGIVRAATYIEWTDKNNATVLQLTPVTQSDKGTHLDIAMRKADGTTKTLSLIDRAYNAANVDDIATIATLDAYTPMVRTTGNQDINGTKSYTYLLRSTILPIESVPYKWTGNNGWKKAYAWDVSNVQRGITFLVHSRNDGRAALYTAIGNTSNGSIHNNTSWTLLDTQFKLAYNIVTAQIELYTSSVRNNMTILSSGISNNEGVLTVTIGDQTEYTEPTADDTFAWVVGVTA